MPVLQKKALFSAFIICQVLRIIQNYMEVSPAKSLILSATIHGGSYFFIQPFLQTLILRGLQHFFFLIIITFSWFDTILTPIFYFWCQLIATLSSLVISLSILDISFTWLYTSIVTSMWLCL